MSGAKEGGVSMRTRCRVSCSRPYANLFFQVKRKQGKVPEAKVLKHTLQDYTRSPRSKPDRQQTLFQLGVLS